MKALCEGLSELGIWTRLHYVYPYPHVDDIIPLMADGKLLPYLDIPFQHASPRILKLMKRPGAVDKTLERIQRWRDDLPGASRSARRSSSASPARPRPSSKQLLDFLDEAQLDRVGAFAYSPVDGATRQCVARPGAGRGEAGAPGALHGAAGRDLRRPSSKRKVGTTQRCLVDALDGELAIARSMADAPEIDGLVQIQDGREAGLKPGDFVDVEIMGTDEHDLFGEVSYERA